jgi:hypothetical protein
MSAYFYAGVYRIAFGFVFTLLLPMSAWALNAGLNVEKFYLEFAFAPPHNEPVGMSDVARYVGGLNLRLTVLENKRGLGILGVEFMPNYYLGGYWPEQVERWNSGELQRLEIRYRVFFKPLKWLEFFGEHYNNEMIKDGDIPSRNRRLHNIFGVKLRIVDNVL